METLLRIVQNEYTQMTKRQLGVVENCSELKQGVTNRLLSQVWKKKTSLQNIYILRENDEMVHNLQYIIFRF